MGWLRRFFMLDRPEHPAAQGSAASSPLQARRPFAVVHIQIGEQGQVRFARLKMSCGNAELDRRAVAELQAQAFPVPRVGRKAVARWHMVRWAVPPEHPPSKPPSPPDASHPSPAPES